MNRIFNVIWSKTKEQWIVVSERVKTNGGVPKSPLRSLAVLAAMLLAGEPAFALDPGALPAGGQITAGSGNIAVSGTRMTVNQASQQMIANWNSFNIGSSAAVQFNQPNAASSALNRITDQNPTQIMGSLSANGRVFLVNPAGVIFGKTARVDVGGITASTLNMLDSDFLAGKYSFSNSGSAGPVINQGLLNAMPGGVVALIGPKVSNEGTITTPGGTATLAAGNQVSIDFKGDGLINLTVDQAAVDALAENKGLIKADGGLVMMTAKAADALTQQVLSNSGVLEANSFVEREGRIILDGGESGVTQSTGTITAKGVNQGETGGAVVMTGDKVGLFDSAVVDVSGEAGGGTVNIGGGFQGKDASVRNASAAVVGTDVKISADALDAGNGGKVVLWSNDHTAFGGSISARGGRVSGDGGAVEVSSKGELDFIGLVDAGAADGKGGSLLLDPLSITVESTGVVTTITSLSFATGSPTSISPIAITNSTNAGTAVTLEANTDITVNSSIVSNNVTGNGGVITLTAGSSITVNADIISDNGNIILNVNNNLATVSGNSANFTNLGHIDAGAGTLTLNFGTKNILGTIFSTGFMSAYDMTINSAKTTLGGDLVLGQTVVDHNLRVYSGGTNITNPSGTVVNIGSTQTPGITTLDASNTGNNVFGNITLSLPATNLNEVLVNSNDFTLADTNAVQFGSTSGTSIIRGNLSITTYGPIGTKGPVQINGTSTFTAHDGGFGTTTPFLELTNASNHFTGTFTATIESGYATVRDSGAMTLGAISVGTDLTLTTGGAITGHSTITVPYQTIITAGSGNNIILDNASNNFNGIRIVSGKDVTLVDQNAIMFGSVYSNTTYTSHIYGALDLTAGGNISQYYYTNYNYSAITVDGTSQFTANNALLPINLYLGPDDPFYAGHPGSANSFVGTITLARGNANTGFSNIQLRNTSSSASVLTGLTSVGILNNVWLKYDNAPAVTLPGMTVGGSLKVYAPSVQNTATVPDNKISQTGSIEVTGDTLVQAASTGDINLSDSGNNFSRITVVGARDAIIRDSNAIVLYGNSGSVYYPFSVSGNLTVTAGGAITDTSVSDNNAPLTVNGGTTTLTALSNDTLTKYDITLDNYYNQLNTVLVPAAQNVILSQYYGNLILGNSIITGTLTITNHTTGYSLTQIGSSKVTTGSTTTFSNFNTITLGSATEARHLD